MVRGIFGMQKQVELYGEDAIQYFKRSKQIEKFVRRKAVKSVGTATTYESRLVGFANFIFLKYPGKELDEFVDELKKEKPAHDVYEVLSDLAVYLKNDRKGDLAGSSVGEIVKTSRKFLRRSGVQIQIEDFRDRVDLPQKLRTNHEPIEKQDIVDILNAIKIPRDKTAILFLSATGARAVEGMSIRLSDLKLDANPPIVRFRAETTKTRTERVCFLTGELAKALRVWLKTKYEPHWSTMREGDKVRQKWVVPEQSEDDLVFGFWHSDGTSPAPMSIYNKTRRGFVDALKRVDKNQFRKDKRRRTITIHSLRRHAKTQISNAGFEQFSEFYLGHAGSTYWRSKESEKVEIFRKIEDRLTFLDGSSIQKFQVDIQSQVDAKDQQIQNLQKQMHEVQQKLDRIIENRIAVN